MIVRKAGLVFGIVLAINSFACSVQAGEPKPCALRWGQPGAPLVPDEETARRIFIAVEERFNPGADLKGFPDVAANDHGDYWGVSRGKAPIQTPRGPIETNGGGQLEMRIAKCDAAITDVHFSR